MELVGYNPSQYCMKKYNVSYCFEYVERRLKGCVATIRKWHNSHIL
jgi:hypothetical protein